MLPVNDLPATAPAATAPAHDEPDEIVLLDSVIPLETVRESVRPTDDDIVFLE